MQDILSESLKKLKKKRVRRMRILAILLILSLVVSLDVFWSLRQPGLTLAGDADCGITEHTHDESCKNDESTCQLTEHIHTIECYSDETADVESQLDWQKMFEEYPFTGNVSKDLVGIAKTQVGYTESKLNFEVSKDGIRHGYTRYGAWYGTPYGNWSATFVSFCLHYSGAPPDEFPINTGATSMAEQWKTLGKYAVAGEYLPNSGDLVFFKDNTVGIVANVLSSACHVIRGDIEGSVKTSIVSLTDESILGWGIVGKQILNEELYDISNGPAVFIFASENNIQRQTYANRKTQTYSLRNATPAQDLVTYLNDKNGSYFFTLLDANDHPVPKDENGNYIVRAQTMYKVTITATSPDGLHEGNYEYHFPNGVELVSVGDGKFVINETTEVGSWSVEKEGTVNLNFNNKINNLSDVIISATVGIIFPADMSEINFDGKINITIEVPREEVKVTEVRKWGVQGDPNNANVINKTDKLDPDKLYWTVQIEGNANSHIPGSKITDQTLKYDWSYEHYYTDSDKAKGIKFGVSVYDPENDTEEWHTWTVYQDDPNLTWGTNGWEYIIPETVTCDKNANSPHEIVLGNDNWTYFIEYSSTPTHIDLAGERGYVNSVSVDNQRQEGWGGFTQSEVKAAVYKNGTLVTDASSAKIIWEIQTTIPKKDPNQRAERDWVISDNLTIVNEWNNGIYSANNEINFVGITANYFGATINVPHYSVATENDPYAYDTYSWSDGKDNGGAIHILQRCVCTEESCGEDGGICAKWQYYGRTTDYCDCWHETEDTTFTIVYETDVTEEIELYGGLGYFARNSVGVVSNITSLWTETRVELPSVIKKEEYQREGTIVKYNITVNEAKLNLTDGNPLVILDEMTNTLAFMRGSLVVKAIDVDGNEVVLQEDIDYEYTYNAPEDVDDKPDKNVLKVTILHPQPVTYTLDYNTTLTMPNGENIEALKYTNMATIYLWGGQAYDTTEERIFPDINIASNAFSIFVHKLSEVDGLPLSGAEFGLFNAQGGLITKATTNDEGKAYFETDIEKGIVLREHKIYYVKELTAPPGYMLDDTIHEFTFCSRADGNCDIYNDLKEEHGLIIVSFDTVGHIDVTNKLANYDLPSTGGIGIYPLLLASAIFVITPLVYRFIRRRKRERRGVG